MAETETQEKEIVGIVTNIIEGRHGAYAVSAVEGPMIYVTFSLADGDVWPSGINLKEDSDEGTWVILSCITRKRSGYRALKARPFEDKDETKFGDEAKRLATAQTDPCKNLHNSRRGERIWT
jgi:hypothetical protein